MSAAHQKMLRLASPRHWLSVADLECLDEIRNVDEQRNLILLLRLDATVLRPRSLQQRQQRQQQGKRQADKPADSNVRESQRRKWTFREFAHKSNADRGHVRVDLLSLRVLCMHQHASALRSEHEHACVAALHERLQGGCRREADEGRQTRQREKVSRGKSERLASAAFTCWRVLSLARSFSRKNAIGSLTSARKRMARRGEASKGDWRSRRGKRRASRGEREERAALVCQRSEATKRRACVSSSSTSLRPFSLATRAAANSPQARRGNK